MVTGSEDTPTLVPCWKRPYTSGPSLGAMTRCTNLTGHNLPRLCFQPYLVQIDSWGYRKVMGLAGHFWLALSLGTY